MEEEGRVKQFTRRSLFDIMERFPGTKVEEKLSLLERKLMETTKCPEAHKTTLTRSLKYFKSDFKAKWVAASYIKDRFMKNNEQWLAGFISLPVWNPQKVGRPVKEFEDLSDRSKRRKTKELREQVPADQLVFAAGVSQRSLGNTDASKIIKEVTATPTRAKKFRKAITSVAKGPLFNKKHTPEEALAIFVEGDFTKKQWNIIRSAKKSIYPCYSRIKEAKKECYPSEEMTRVTETCAEIQLQALLDHTVSRICKYADEVIKTCTDEEKQNMQIIVKWGCDGSQQSQFKQKFENSTDSDANIFQSSLVPIRLVAGNDNKKVIWQNPAPSSVRYCRPIRIRFVKESRDITNEEIKYVEDQAKLLQSTNVSTSHGMLTVSHVLIPTMVDGKICNAVTNTLSTMRCYICGLTSKDFNKLQNVPQVNAEALKFGLSVLHARIRFFESLLHLAYKLSIKKWQARSAEEKKIVKETKERIQQDFKERMGLLVDVPKAGFGNTNDGNTSRRFFSDPETASQITGLDLSLIKRFKVILEVISSGFEVHVEKYDEYARNTAKMYVDLYGWHPMSPTIHKVLIHGGAVIANAILPIGQLSEEAAEARNKHFRQYRLDFARKFSRELCNRDILNRLLLTSDPFLSSSRRRPQTKRIPFSKEALELLVSNALTTSSDVHCSERDETEDSNEDDDTDCESE